MKIRIGLFIKSKYIILFCSIYIIKNSNAIFNNSIEEEIKNIESYLKLCENTNLKELFFFKKKNNPRVSIISSVYNKDKYLLRFLKSISYQNFKDIEIILINDCSMDNTLKLMKLYKNIDKRIILINNKKNFGTFRSRNIGILASKGDYVILPDPDDLLSKNSIKMLYTLAKKYNYEMIKFILYLGKNKIFMSRLLNETKNRPVFSPEIQTYLYYATGKLSYIDFDVANKFIKRNSLIRSLNLLGKKYLNIYMNTYEDQLLNFILHRTVNSFYFLKHIGYYYLMNQFSITKRGFHPDDIKNIFTNLIIIFNFSKNNNLERNMFNYFFRHFVIKKCFLNRTNLFKRDIDYYIKAIDSFIKNDFVSINNKKYMKLLKKNII